MATSEHELSIGHHSGRIFKTFNEVEEPRGCQQQVVGVCSDELQRVYIVCQTQNNGDANLASPLFLLRSEHSYGFASEAVIDPVPQGTPTFPFRPQIYSLRSPQRCSVTLQIPWADSRNTGSLKRAISLSTSAKAPGSSFWRFTRVRQARHLG